MEIKAYRARFEGKEAIGTPIKSSALLDVMRVKEEPDAFVTDETVVYAISTHDRGSDDQTPSESAYYQIVFRILYEDSELENNGVQFDELELVLDKDHDNPLVYNPQADLWYQPTFFKPDGHPLTKNDIDNNKKLRKKYAHELRYVDSIRTAGVFSVCLRSKRYPLTIFDKKTVYVLPSLFDSESYKYMLDRLLSIHERLVINVDSAVGIGSRDVKKKERQAGNPKYDAELWQRLKPEIQAVMHMPAILQQKCYYRLPDYKLKRFDGRVMRSHTRSGGQWAEGIMYEDDHDIQENRIIKRILQRFSTSVLPSQRKAKLDEGEIERQVVEELSSKFNPYALAWYKNAQRSFRPPTVECEKQNVIISQGMFQRADYQNGRKKRIYFKYNPNNGQFEIWTNPPEKWNSKKGAMAIPDFIYYPFSDGERPQGLYLTTVNCHTALEIILSLSKLYDMSGAEAHKKQMTLIYYGGYSSTIHNDNYGYGCGIDVTGVTITRIENVISCRLDGDDYQHTQIKSLFELYCEILNSNALKFMQKVPEMEIVEFVLSRKDSYTMQNAHIDAVNMAVSARVEIQNILSSRWFTAITPVHILRFQQTPLFLYNQHYRAIYNLMCEIMQDHPLLISNFDENLYGVHDTALIYEYWVFYELLNRFLNLGFIIDGNTNQVNSQLRNMFVDHLLKSSTPEGFCVCLHKDIALFDDNGIPSGNTSSFEIMIGFNCIFGDQKAPAHGQFDRYLTPDYFIRVTRDDGYHWYFLDAKYECYSEKMLYIRAEKGKRKNSIGDVCVDKYITRMQEKQFIDEFAAFHCKEFQSYWRSEFLHSHHIEGSYLIIVRYQEEPNEQIPTKDRLCGDSSHGITNERPMHRFGSIVFRPGKEDEMTSLIEMIFEYKEGCEQIRVGKPQLRKGALYGKEDMFNDEDAQITHIHVQQAISEFPTALLTCWDSSVDHTMIDMSQQSIHIAPQLTKTNRYKYRIICPCGSRRYENYCICKTCRREITKHDVGNFLYRRSSTQRLDRWNYVCPYCGNDIDPMERDTTETSIPNDIDQMFIQSQVLYDEPPPLSDEELLAAVPPEDIDYDYGYL